MPLPEEALRQPPAGLSPHWSHPQANSRILLPAQEGPVLVAYQRVSSRRRTIGMLVSRHGLQVRTPLRLAQTEIEDVLQRKSGWILRKLEEFAVPSSVGAALPGWSDGACFAYQGRWVQVALGLAGRHCVLQALGRPQPLPETARQAGADAVRDAADAAPQHGGLSPAPAQVGHLLHVPVAVGGASAAIALAVQRWLRRQAAMHIDAVLEQHAAAMGVRPQRVALSNAGTRWGSASGSGNIRLHWRLVQMAPELLEYVLVHELAHLHEMNHGPHFWAWVERRLPDYAQRRARLNAIRLEPWAEQP